MKTSTSQQIDIFPEIKVSQNAKPFIKWAGGKSKLIPQFAPFFPKELTEGDIENYYEPFLGGGAVFFHIVQNYTIKNAFLFDINDDLILMYKVVQRDVFTLIEEIIKLRNNYSNLSESEQENFFYSLRKEVNQQIQYFDYNTYDDAWVIRAAKLIFLNKTCFNGLFRQNSKGEFNVPFGRYKNPQIIDEDNLIIISNLLQSATIEKRGFAELEKSLMPKAFVYLDPPYRPISKTASFTSYSKFDFNEEAQISLAEMLKRLQKNKSVKIMLSNSDPHNEDMSDNFFQNNYGQHGFLIDKVYASRMINCDSSKRGKISELIIRNYEV